MERGKCRSQEFLRRHVRDRAGADELLVSIRRPVFTGEVWQLLFAHSSPSTADIGRGCARRVVKWRKSKRFVWRWDASDRRRLRLTELEAKIRGGESKRQSQNDYQSEKPYLKKTLEPIDDLLGSAEYKLYIAGVLLERALAQALETSKKSRMEEMAERTDDSRCCRLARPRQWRKLAGRDPRARNVVGVHPGATGSHGNEALLRISGLRRVHGIGR